jgi:hypothetical protein
MSSIVLVESTVFDRIDRFDEASAALPGMRLDATLRVTNQPAARSLLARETATQYF